MDFAEKQEWVTYVIDYEENRSQPPEIQMTVEVRGLTYGEEQKYTENIKLLGKGGKKGFKTNSSVVKHKMFIDNVRNPKNITFGKKPAKGPGEIWDKCPIELVQDIVDAIEIRSHLEEGDIKNLSA